MKLNTKMTVKSLSFDDTQLSTKQKRKFLTEEMKKLAKPGKGNLFQKPCTVSTKPKSPALLKVWRLKTTSRQNAFGTQF